jgi:hypothetical protein
MRRGGSGDRAARLGESKVPADVAVFAAHSCSDQQALGDERLDAAVDRAAGRLHTEGLQVFKDLEGVRRAGRHGGEDGKVVLHSLTIALAVRVAYKGEPRNYAS